MPTPQQNDGPQNSGTEPSPTPVKGAVLEHQQRRRMLLALVVLLLALISVLIKDHQFWFPSDPGIESETPERNAPQSISTAPAKLAEPMVPARPVAPPHLRPKSKRLSPTAPSAAETAAMSPVITATNRAVLPPLEVEVVAGNQHRSVSPANNSVNVEMQSADSASQDSATGAANFSAHVQMSPGTVQVVSRPVDPSYPLLAKQMKVQGAVVLEALISKSGSIQDIQVVSGPAILSAAAREAVKQWHFKPYYQGGQAVETAARITVNFTISTY